MSSEASTPDERAKRVWSLGSYADIAPHFLGVAAHLVEACEVDSGDSVLDVACGTGNVAITAARRGALVTGVDLVPGMLADAERNASIAGFEEIDWREGNATDLPFEDDTFDFTLSCFGHMFAEPADVAGAELVRVTHPGGTIGFTSWTPSSVVPAMGAVLREYLPAEAGPTEPPFRWGDPDVVRERIGERVTDLAFDIGTVTVPTLAPARYWEKAITESGLFIAALDTIDEADHPPIRQAVIETIGSFFDERSNAVPMEYRLTTARVR